MEAKIDKNIDNMELAPDWVVPDAFAMPEWVMNILEKFKTEVKNNLGKPDENAKTKKLIEELILDKKVKAKYPLNKKTIGQLVTAMWEKFPDREFIYRYWVLMQAGFFLSTFKPSGFSPESLKLPEIYIKKKQKILQEYQEKLKTDGKEKAIAWVDEEFNKLADEVIAYWDKNGVNVSDIVYSKARGSANDIRKMLVAVGLSINTNGEINDVIMNSQIDGLTQTQFFNYSSQAIAALYAKSSETAVPGYLSRKLSTIAEPVILSSMHDCGSKKYLEVEILNDEILEALDGRVMDNGKTIKSTDEKLIGKRVKIRSSLHCKAKDGICATCYNPSFIKKLGLKPKARIGLMATTSIGNDALVNLTLKKSHVGLSLNLEKVDLNKDIFTYAE